MALTMYGIPNCDTIKKARNWLDHHGIAFAFHDYKKAGVDHASLEDWVGEHGWEAILNRTGTTFRSLPETERADLDATKAIALMLTHPSMIKRPILDTGDRRILGFKPDAYAAIFTGSR